MRKVKLFKTDLKFNLIEIGFGVFHQFGVNYKEFEGEPGMYTTAIVEMPDGKVMNIDVRLIQFVEPTSEGEM